MNTFAKINSLEKKIAGLGAKDRLLWICICGDNPCSCTEEHKRGICKKSPSGSCAECKSSSTWIFMTDGVPAGTPIVSKEKFIDLVESAKKGDIKLPLPILGGQSTG